MNLKIFLFFLSVIIFTHTSILNAQDHYGNNPFPLITQEGKSFYTTYNPEQIILPSQINVSQMNSSEDLKYLINQSVRQNWDGKKWIDAWQYAYEYGSNNKVTSLTYSTSYETNWNPYWQTLTTYNDSNKITQIINEFWDGEHWLPNSRSVRDYDENQEMTEIINYLYQDRWIESSRLLYTYDTIQRIITDNDTINKTVEQITQLWNGYWAYQEKNITYYSKMAKKYFPVESITQIYYISYWADKSRTLYKYDSLYNLTEHVRQVPGTADWVNEKRNVYKYDGKNNTEDLYQEWGGSGDDTGWRNVKIYLKIYTHSSLSEKVYKEWIGDEWLNISRNVPAYANDTISEDLFQVWADPYWVNDKLHSYTYDMNKCRTEDLHSRWNGDTWIWWERELFSYLTVTAVETYDIKMVPMKLFNNYPNPFDLNTTISYIISEPGSVTLKIYNAAGEEIETLVNENQHPGKYYVIFISPSLPTGVYFYQLKFEGFVETKKMILVK